MKKYIKLIIIITLLMLFIIVSFLFFIQDVQYNKNLFYMDTYINIKLNSSNKIKAEKALEEAEKLYETYHNLTNRYSVDSELYLLNNTIGEVEVEQRLYELIEYAYSWYDKSNGLFNINMGGIINAWKKYRENGMGIPSKEELDANINIANIQLLENNTILNNGANIDLGGITKGYVTKLVGQKFDELGINDYIINAGGNVLVGNKKTDQYKIGIQSPLEDASVYQVIRGNDISVVTSGGYERFYEYEGKLYHHIIDPNTKFPSEHMKSVTVICEDSALADILSTTLFLMPIEKGIEYLEKYPNVEAVWYSNENQIIKSEGFSKYE